MRKLPVFKPSPRRYCFRCGKMCINTKGATSRAFVRVNFTWPWMKQTFPLETNLAAQEYNEHAYIMCRQCFGKNLFFPLDRKHYHSIKDYDEETGERVDLWGEVVWETRKYRSGWEWD